MDDKVKVRFIQGSRNPESVAWSPSQAMLIPLSSTPENCRDILLHLLPDILEEDNFYFLISDQISFSLGSLGTILQESGISTECTVEVFVYPADFSAKLNEEVLYPDWIRSIHAHDSTVAFGCYDNYLRIKDSSKNEVAIPGHKGVINSIDHMADGSLVTGGADCSIRVFRNNKLGWSIPAVSAVQKVCALSTSILSAEFNGTLSLHSSTKPNKKAGHVPLASIQAHKDCISSLFLSGSTVVSAGHDRTVRLSDSTSLATLYSAALPSSITCGTRLGDMLMFGSADGSIRLLTTELALCKVVKYHRCWVSDVAAAPDGTRFAVSDHNGNVSVFDARMLVDPIWSTTAKGKVLCLAWSQDNHLFFGGEECILRDFIIK
jgi:WD40 repeat protein